MSKEQERETIDRLKMPSGENIMPTLDAFTVRKVETDRIKIHDAMSEEANEK